MVFQWRDFLRTATSLLKAATEENVRSSVSRSYYAAFGEVRLFIENETGHRLSTANVHATVLDLLAAHPDKGRNILGSDLNNLRSTRNKADYDLAPRMDQRVATKALSDANGILTDLASL